MKGFVWRPQNHDAGIEMTETLQDTTAVGRDVEHSALDARPLLRTSGYNDHDDNNDENEIDERLLVRQKDYKQRPFIANSRRRNIVISIMSVLVTIISIALIYRTFAQNHNKTETSNYKIGPHWPGFSKIETYFAFGDSWTTTHFDSKGEQPSTKNPIGNPPLPGLTSSNGLNYVGYLTTRYNHSFIKTYDHAFGGSVIDAEVDRTLLEWLDFAHQLRDEFAKHYVTNTTGIFKPSGWNPESALFSTFFGINDVLVFDRKNPQLDRVFATYENVVGSLYNMSARNFLLMNIPPIDRAPTVTNRPAQDKKDFAEDVKRINDLINDLALHLRKKYKDITIFQMDVHSLFTKIMDDPKSTVQTACYQNVTKPCPAYNNRLDFGASPTKAQIEACGGIGVEGYLWFDDLHVTWPVHDAIAAEIERLLISPGLG